MKDLIKQVKEDLDSDDLMQAILSEVRGSPLALYEVLQPPNQWNRLCSVAVMLGVRYQCEPQALVPQMKEKITQYLIVKNA